MGIYRAGAAGMAGFLFAFYRYTGHDADSCAWWSHCLTRCCTGQEQIHVEMIPVLRREGSGQLVLAPESYTSYMGQPFGPSDAQDCLGPGFDLVFLPAAEQFQQGSAWLRSLRGRPYCSYGWLVWVGAARLCCAGTGRGDDKAVFCSYAGALLLLQLGQEAPPSLAYCTPGDLYVHLVGLGAKVVDPGVCSTATQGLFCTNHIV